MSICKKHPRYRGLRKPKTKCAICKVHYAFRRLLKACGYKPVQPYPEPFNPPKPPEVGDFLFIGGPCHGEYRSVELPADKLCIYNDTHIYRPHHLVAHQPSPSGAPHKVFILEGFSWDAAKEYFTIVSKALEDAAKECRGALSGEQARAQQAAVLRNTVMPPLIKPVSNEQVRNMGPDAKVD